MANYKVGRTATKAVPAPPPRPSYGARSGVLEISAAFKSDNPNHRVEFQLVDPATLLIDTSIQRSIVQRDVNRIVRKFNPSAIGSFTVSVRDVYDADAGELTTGRFLVDGQQRQEAIRIVGWTGKVPSIVHFGLSKEEEALLFIQLNERDAVSAWDKYKARLESGEEQALEIQAMLQEIGIPLGGPKGFQAIMQADAVYSNGARGPANLRFALQMVHEVYGSYDGRVIAGLAHIYNEFHAFLDIELLRAKLQQYAPSIGALIQQAKLMGQLHGGKSTLQFAEAIVNTYNRKMRGTTRHSKALPSVYLGRNKKPSGRDLEGLSTLREEAAQAADRDDFDEDDLDLDDED